MRSADFDHSPEDFQRQLEQYILERIQERQLGPEAMEWICERLGESSLKEQLYFKGSPCTVDCSGHRAGYEWWFRKRRAPNSWSQSFNNGANLAAAGK